MMEIRKDYYPEDIALALCSIADENFENFDEYGEINPKVEDLKDTLYDLMAICENKYNKDSFRTLWNTLQDISEKFSNGEV